MDLQKTNRDHAQVDRIGDGQSGGWQLMEHPQHGEDHNAGGFHQGDTGRAGPAVGPPQQPVGLEPTGGEDPSGQRVVECIERTERDEQAGLGEHAELHPRLRAGVVRATMGPSVPEAGHAHRRDPRGKRPFNYRCAMRTGNAVRGHPTLPVHWFRSDPPGGSLDGNLRPMPHPPAPGPARIPRMQVSLPKVAVPPVSGRDPAA